VQHANVPLITSIIINSKLATLRELQEYYTYEDGLDLLEMILVKNNNEAIQAKHQQNLMESR